MNVMLDSDVLQLFPDASVSGMVVSGIDNIDVPSIVDWKSKALRSVAERQINPELLTAEPEVLEWRDAYRKFRVRPSEYRSSVEQLLRRALRGSLPEAPVAFVNLYCYLSIITAVPIGGYDMTKLRGSVRIRLSKEDEDFTPLGGGGQTTKSEPGVVVYSDDAGIICWAWNYRDSARTCLDPDSKRVLVFADSSTRRSRPKAGNAMTLLSESVTSLGCSASGGFILDALNNRIELD